MLTNNNCMVFDVTETSLSVNGQTVNGHLTQESVLEFSLEDKLHFKDPCEGL